MQGYSCWDGIQGAHFQDGIGNSVSILGQESHHVWGNLPDVLLTEFMFIHLNSHECLEKIINNRTEVDFIAL